MVHVERGFFEPAIIDQKLSSLLKTISAWKPLVEVFLRHGQRLFGRFGFRRVQLGVVGLVKRSERLNKKRNAIVHQGAFASKREMRELVNLSREIVNELVIPWEPEFVLGGEELTSSKLPKAKRLSKISSAKSGKKKS